MKMTLTFEDTDEEDEYEIQFKDMTNQELIRILRALSCEFELEGVRKSLDLLKESHECLAHSTP